MMRDTTGETPARVAARPIRAEIEPAADPVNSDHVWLHVDVGDDLPFIITLNTLSKRNRDMGFDPRVRIARVHGEATADVEPGIFPGLLLDYTRLEALHNVYYETPNHEELREVLLRAIEQCWALEAWGFLFGRGRRRGLHQVHCRHASCAVAEHLEGRDGGVRFHYRDRDPVLHLFKFCGQ